MKCYQMEATLSRRALFGRSRVAIVRHGSQNYISGIWKEYISSYNDIVISELEEECTVYEENEHGAMKLRAGGWPEPSAKSRVKFWDRWLK